MRHRQAVGRGSSIATLGAIVTLVAAGAASASPSEVQLRGSLAPAASSPRIGSVAGGAAVEFEVQLNLSNPKGAAAVAKAVSTPGNAQYGKYLTAAQWERRFSPSSAAVARVTAFLKAGGFTVHAVAADRTVVSASGSASQIEHVFSTSLSYHRVEGLRLRLADRSLSIPANLAGVVLGVVGVNQTLAHPNHTTGNSAAPAAASPATGSPFPPPPGFRVATPCGAYYNQLLDTTLPPFGNGYPATPPWAVCGYKPAQFRSAYNLTGANNGAGVRVGIVDAFASPTIFADASKYASLNDPANPLSQSQFSQQLASTFTDSALCGTAGGWYGEETLDVEAVHATAPGAKIVFAGAKNCTTPSLNDALRKLVDTHSADVITNSYGDNGGDALDSPADRQSTDVILQMAAATGISVMFSSGDNGDEFTSFGRVLADYPASSPWATAVGGTSLQVGSSGQRIGEYGWSTARSYLCNQTYITLGGCPESARGTWQPINQALDGGSGGGTSVVYPQPFYQRGVVPSSLSQRNSSQPMRVEPDISMTADPATGMLVGETQVFPNGVYYDQYRIGGTSLASPLFAGVIARADQAAGHALGFVNPALYSLHGQSQAIYDVTPAGKQTQSRADFANSISPQDGFLFTTRIIEYQGDETFCATSELSSCRTQKVAISTAPGFDSMTGLGSPTNNFVGALAVH